MNSVRTARILNKYIGCPDICDIIMEYTKKCLWDYNLACQYEDANDHKSFNQFITSDSTEERYATFRWFRDWDYTGVEVDTKGKREALIIQTCYTFNHITVYEKDHDQVYEYLKLFFEFLE